MQWLLPYIENLLPMSATIKEHAMTLLYAVNLMIQILAGTLPFCPNIEVLAFLCVCYW